MKFVKQRQRHDPKNGQFGDCYPAVLACFLGIDIEKIPNFCAMSEDEGDWLEESSQWLQKHGYYPLRLVFAADQDEGRGFSNIQDMISLNNPGLYYMLAGNAAEGVGHVVICLDGEIVWDPSPAGVGITGPNNDGCYSVEILIPNAFINQNKSVLAKVLE